jgi:hypothetical protein
LFEGGTVTCILVVLLLEAGLNINICTISGLGTIVGLHSISDICCQVSPLNSLIF